MFKDRLTQLRKEKKLTQGEMAEKVGVHRGTYANYERGHRQPDYETLVKIADFFEVSTDFLLRGEDHYRDKARELRKHNDVRFAAVDGREFSDSEKEEILADALRRIDGIEKIIEERFKKKNEDKN
ncbi:helix-turn-helix transcriptional regulator [Bacillus amyloliquefaciens]|uniref:helix-turn-helix domain-containing protein n=1 Tax=Bacillus amyloliquefaciens TaxID=1390 RepID=UPI001F4C7EE5|nr:helix-turn-helix domain-containing protein [Bacillus amyloliquefaciens]UNE49914.1 helix-turn-helix transcriptional regulator [Bacillus amyloliquefaciens]